MKNTLLLVLVFLFVGTPLPSTPSAAAGAAGDQAAAQAAVRRADAAMVAAARAANADAWLAFYGADAVVLLPNDRLVLCSSQARPALSRLLGRGLAVLDWRPGGVQVASSGDLAYVSGTYELRFDRPNPASDSDRGTRSELWSRQADGSWKCIVDAWSPGPAAAATPAVRPEIPVPAAPAARAPEATAGAPAAPARTHDAKYGDEPVHYRDAIQAYFDEHLREPDSIRYERITEPQKGYTKAIAGTLLMRETRRYGWTVEATIDARNPHGAYVGFKTYKFLFRGEKIVDVVAPLPDGEMK